LLAAGALAYLATHMGDRGPLVFLDAKPTALFVLGGSSFGTLGAALVGARLRPQGQQPVPRDAHHSALQRAGVLSIVAAVATTSTLTPTRFFWLPPLMLVLGAVVGTKVTLRDRAFERRLVAIADGKDETYAIIPAAKDGPELLRVTRWGGEIGALEHGYVVNRSAAGSYRDTGGREEPLRSVAIGRIDSAPRAVIVVTTAASLAGLSLVLAFMLAAPMISVPTSVRSLYGPTTRCRLHGITWYEAKAVMPSDVVLYDVDAGYAKPVEHTPPFPWIGYDRARGVVLSPTELFLRIAGTNHDAELLSFVAVNLLVDAPYRQLDGSASIDGRELRFSYSFAPNPDGRRWRATSTKTLYRCSANLDTAVLSPCSPEEVEDSSNGGMGTPVQRVRDPHHAK
jgi:hypothetical protein